MHDAPKPPSASAQYGIPIHTDSGLASGAHASCETASLAVWDLHSISTVARLAKIRTQRAESDIDIYLLMQQPGATYVYTYEYRGYPETRAHVHAGTTNVTICVRT